MPLPPPFPGLVLHYSYLWHDERIRGLEEGNKDRPAVVVSAVPSADGALVVIVVPVTHREPRNPDDAVEIPVDTKRRLRLDDQRSWILVSEINRFRWPGPDLRPLPGKPAGSFTYGVIPPGLFRQAKERLLLVARRRDLRTTAR